LQHLVHSAQAGGRQGQAGKGGGGQVGGPPGGGGSRRRSRLLLLAGRGSLPRVMVAVMALLLLLVEGWLRLLHLGRRQIVLVALSGLIGPPHPPKGRR
jgi:hypothetical protein